MYINRLVHNPDSPINVSSFHPETLGCNIPDGGCLLYQTTTAIRAVTPASITSSSSLQSSFGLTTILDFLAAGSTSVSAPLVSYCVTGHSVRYSMVYVMFVVGNDVNVYFSELNSHLGS